MMYMTKKAKAMSINGIKIDRVITCAVTVELLPELNAAWILVCSEGE